MQKAALTMHAGVLRLKVVSVAVLECVRTWARDRREGVSDGPGTEGDLGATSDGDTAQDVRGLQAQETFVSATEAEQARRARTPGWASSTTEVAGSGVVYV